MKLHLLGGRNGRTIEKVLERIAAPLDNKRNLRMPLWFKFEMIEGVHTAQLLIKQIGQIVMNEAGRWLWACSQQRSTVIWLLGPMLWMHKANQLGCGQNTIHIEASSAAFAILLNVQPDATVTFDVVHEVVDDQLGFL